MLPINPTKYTIPETEL